MRWVTIHRYTVFVFDQATWANSAWPSSVGSHEYWRSDGYGEVRNGESATMTAGTLIESVKVMMCLFDRLRVEVVMSLVMTVLCLARRRCRSRRGPMVLPKLSGELSSRRVVTVSVELFVYVDDKLS